MVILIREIVFISIILTLLSALSGMSSGLFRGHNLQKSSGLNVCFWCLIDICGHFSEGILS